MNLDVPATSPAAIVVKGRTFVTHDPRARRILAATYDRLREKLARKRISAERLRAAALEALAKVKAEAELDKDWIDQEIKRLRSSRTR